MEKLLGRLPPWPDDEYSRFGEVEIGQLGRVQQITAAHLGRNWIAIPHVTHHDEVDVTEVEAGRAAWNAQHPDAKLTLLVPIIKAVVEAIDAFPIFATSLGSDGLSLVWKKYRHIGIATETPTGLLVPVIRDCDKADLASLAQALTTLSQKARSKGLSMAEMSGGIFTISSLGHIGGTAFTPIVNAPEVAILGVSRAHEVARRDTKGSIIWRQVLPLSLSYDHRVINGADAARFLRHIAERLATFQFT